MTKKEIKDKFNALAGREVSVEVATFKLKTGEVCGTGLVVDRKDPILADIKKLGKETNAAVCVTFSDDQSASRADEVRVVIKKEEDGKYRVQPQL